MRIYSVNTCYYCGFACLILIHFFCHQLAMPSTAVAEEKAKEPRPKNDKDSPFVLECKLQKITSYNDAVVMTLSLHNQTTKPLRINHRSIFLWFRGFAFQDADGNQWATLWLKNRYQFAPTTEKNTFLLRPDEVRELVIVDSLEEPVFKLVNADLGKKPPLPRALGYTIHRKLANLPGIFGYCGDIAKGEILILLVGKGSVGVTRMDRDVPDEKTTRLLPLGKVATRVIPRRKGEFSQTSAKSCSADGTTLQFIRVVPSRPEFPPTSGRRLLVNVSQSLLD